MNHGVHLRTNPPERLPSLAELRDAVSREPTYPNLINCAVVARVSGDLDLAADLLARAHATAPDRIEVWNNLGLLWTDQGQFHGAVEAYSRALRIAKATGADPNIEKNVGLGYAESLMRIGRFREAWPHWERGRAFASWRPKLGSETWDGMPGQKVVVVPEGGFGDAFLYRRWLPALASMSARVTLLLWKELMDFCDWREFGVDSVVELPRTGLPFDASTVDPEERSISWMSLPALFRMAEWKHIPRDPKHQRRQPPPVGRPRIGFCWRAEENSSMRRVRTLNRSTYLELSETLTERGDVFSLVPDGKELHEHSQPEFPPLPDVIHDRVKMWSWRTTFDYIQTFDWVVTVDTAVAHLAGLAGVETALLLPVRSDWKWGISGTHDYWYGPHMHYVRNQNPLRWEPEKIGREVAALMDGKA